MTFALSVNLIEASKNISHSLSLKRSLSHTHPIPHEVEDPQHAYWLQRAVHLADLATAYQKLTQEGKMKTPDHPYSLYEGVAGMCCAWAEVLVRLGDGPGTPGGNGSGNGSGSGSGNRDTRVGVGVGGGSGSENREWEVGVGFGTQKWEW